MNTTGRWDAVFSLIHQATKYNNLTIAAVDKAFSPSSKCESGLTQVKVQVERDWPTLRELRKLNETRGGETVGKLAVDYGGVEGLCQRLGVEPSRGLPNRDADLVERRRQYGTNTVPRGKTKSLVRLLLDASRDPTLMILVVAGFVSLGLSFYPSTNEDDDFTSSRLPPHHTEKSSTPQISQLSNAESSTAASALVSQTAEAKMQNVTKLDGGEREEHESAWIEGAAILVCVVVVVLVTAINDYSKERQFRSLQAKIETGHQFSVIRDGEAIDVPVSELVVGDVIRVKYGDLIPADGILLQSHDLRVDESSLTGESDHVAKSVEEDPMLLSGSYAMEGGGKMVVTAVGVNSQTGIIMTLLTGGRLEGGGDSSITSTDDDKDSPSLSSSSSSSDSTSSGSGSSGSDYESDTLHSKSILQTKLSTLALQIIYCGTTVAVLALAVLVISYCIEEYRSSGQIFNIAHLHHFVKFFIIGVTILVISIPEGLPLAIALSLTYSVKKMMKDNNLVRHLDACETMGNATTICSDKTGTLTTNRMTVVQSYVCGHYCRDEKSQPSGGQLPANVVQLLAESIAINSSYNSMIVAPMRAGEREQQLGNKTECGLLGFVQRLSAGSYEEIRRKHPEEAHVKVFTFNSMRKSMTTIVELFANGEENGGQRKKIGYRVYCKGAAEIMLSRCAFILDSTGRPQPFDEERSEEVHSIIKSMAHSGLRTICIAYKDYVYAQEGSITARRVDPTAVQISDERSALEWADEESVSSALVALGICGIQDPIREEVPAAIQKCKRAGITVRMVTGDNVNTARAIALQCRILEPGDDYLVLEGREFNESIRDNDGNISQTKLDAIWPRLRVLARAQPADKYTLVKGIIESRNSIQREIVAVTGDGTNDGPALKKADVGFAMGIAGTDVAKEASDIILTDDNFTSIVKAVMWGRNVYDSISKFLQFQLTVNVVAVLTAFISACVIRDSPLKAVHMLWINLIMDTLASLALATESPTDELLLRKPYGRNKSLISRTMLKNIVMHAAYQLSILLVLLFKGATIFGIASGIDAPLYSPPSQHFTIVFNAFVMMTLFNEINSRKCHSEHNVFSQLLANRTFCAIWISTFICQILIVELGGKWFSTHALTWHQWTICLLLGISELAYGQLVAAVPSKRLPAWCKLMKGAVRPSPLTLHRREDADAVKSAAKSELATSSIVHKFSSHTLPHHGHVHGKALWRYSVRLIGLHHRVLRALEEEIREQKTLGETAPKMSAAAAERWRQSYRRYRRKKHLDRRDHRRLSMPAASANDTPTSPCPRSMSETLASSRLPCGDNSSPSPQGDRKKYSCATILGRIPQQPAADHSAEEQLHRRIRRLMRPASAEFRQRRSLDANFSGPFPSAGQKDAKSHAQQASPHYSMGGEAKGETPPCTSISGAQGKNTTDLDPASSEPPICPPGN